MKRAVVLTLLLLAGIAWSRAETAAKPPASSGPAGHAAKAAALDCPAEPDAYCANASLPPNRLCSYIPHDVKGKVFAGYDKISANCQFPFDLFSWQSFVALNYPAGSGDFKNVTSPRVWETYQTPDQVFKPSPPPVVCPNLDTRGKKVLSLMAKNESVLGPSPFFESTGQPLIDRNLNFTLYEIHVNPREVAYLTGNELNTQPGQITFRKLGKHVVFPEGKYGPARPGDPGGDVGPMEIKAAWRILQTDKGDDPRRYYSEQAVITLDPANSPNPGQPFCVQATVGLVGLHILHKTQNGQGWVWTTFEHVDNAPQQGQVNPQTRYSFYNQGCPGCPVNQAPVVPAGQTFRWAANPPYARAYATNGAPYGAPGKFFGTQVARVQQTFAETAATNPVWQQRLAGTVWANYQLIGSQWFTIETRQGVPVKESNTVLETYVQSHPKFSSCINCHLLAQTWTGQPSDFSFLLNPWGGAPKTGVRAPRASH
jgi:hypothetical protein